MPDLTEALVSQIVEELFAAYQAQFGEAWTQNLTRNLRPSPVKEIAARHGISLKKVQDIKHRIWLAATMAAHAQAAQQTPPLE